MSHQEVKKTLEDVISLAKKHGAEECDALFSRGSSLSMSSQKSLIDKYQLSQAMSLGVRVLKNGSFGVSYSESLAPDALEIMVKSALEMSRFATPDDHNKIENTGCSDQVEQRPEMNIHEDIAESEKIDLAIKLESEALKRDTKVQACPYNGFSESEGSGAYYNSHGNFCFHSEKSYSCYTSALLSEEGKQAMFWSAQNSRKFQDLNVGKVLDETFEHVIPLLKAGPLATGEYLVSFETSELIDFLGCFLSPFSAENVLQKKSKLADSLGKQIAHSDLTILDTGKPEGGFSWSTFDDEGFSKKDINLLENGVLKTFYHNSYTSRKMNQANTFHASRGTQSNLGISSDNWVIAPGKSAHSDLVQNKHIEIIELHGLHSGTNAISGDFSVGVSGYLIENGKRVQTFKENTLSGNFFSMLKDIEAIGNQQFWNKYKTFKAPKILFKGLSIAG